MIGFPKAPSRQASLAALVCSLLSGSAACPGLSAQTPHETTVGFELDALPFVLGGYYGSVWLGIDHLRVRGVVTSTTLPAFLVEEGFEDADMDVLALIIDYMPRGGFGGPWIGAGVERWDRSIESTTDAATGAWDDIVATVGAGWVWKLRGNLYLNPWAAGHVLVGGDTDVPVGSGSYRADRFVVEASVKVGWHF